jgi:hypothetical protein
VLSLWPGTYHVTAQAGTAIVDGDLVVSGDGPAGLTLAAPATGPVVAGRVTDARDDTPLADCRVTAQAGVRLCAETRTDARGVYELRGVSEGAVRISVRALGAHWWRDVDVPVHGAEAIDFRVPGLYGPRARTVPFTISVRSAEDHRPIAGASVLLRGCADGAWVHLGSFRTDADGGVSGTVAALPETVVVVRDANAHAGAELRPDALDRVEVELEPDSASRK